MVSLVSVKDFEALSAIITPIHDLLEQYLQKYKQIRASKPNSQVAAAGIAASSKGPQSGGHMQVKIVATHLDELEIEQLNEQQRHCLNCLQYLFVETIRGENQLTDDLVVIIMILFSLFKILFSLYM